MKTVEYNKNISSYLRSNNITMQVDENKVHFVNGLAVVKAIIDSNETYLGIINEQYQEAFGDEADKYGDARRNLMFLGFNRDIVRIGENDFIVNVCCDDDEHIFYENRHIKINGMKATFVNRDIGAFKKTNDENILITNKTLYQLYNVEKGSYIGEKYDDISIVDGYPDCFAVRRKIKSEIFPKDDNLCLTDDLYYQIDQNGHIISKIFSQRKLDFLDYDDIDIDKYPMYREEELKEENKKLKETVHAFMKSKTRNF